MAASAMAAPEVPDDGGSHWAVRDPVFDDQIEQGERLTGVRVARGSRLKLVDAEVFSEVPQANPAVIKALQDTVWSSGLEIEEEAGDHFDWGGKEYFSDGVSWADYEMHQGNKPGTSWHNTPVLYEWGDRADQIMDSDDHIGVQSGEPNDSFTSDAPYSLKAGTMLSTDKP